MVTETKGYHRRYRLLKRRKNNEQDRVTQELCDQLSQFRLTHAYKYLNVAGVRWKYLISGQGKETLLLLPGAPGICETSFQQILQFERTYRLLAMNYPSAATTIPQVLSGLQAILAAEHIDRFHVIGNSYGGTIAQRLMLQMPQRIDKLVLICTGVPNQETARKFNLYYSVLSLLPVKWVHTLLLWGKSHILAVLNTHGPFWNVYYDQMIVTLSKEDYLARIQVWIDFHQHGMAFQEKDIQLHGHMLIIEAENDSVFPLKEQQYLRDQYPQAQVYVFLQAPHILAVSNVPALLEIITGFLQEKVPERSMNEIRREHF